MASVGKSRLSATRPSSAGSKELTGSKAGGSSRLRSNGAVAGGSCSRRALICWRFSDQLWATFMVDRFVLFVIVGPEAYSFDHRSTRELAKRLDLLELNVHQARKMSARQWLGCDYGAMEEDLLAKA